MLVGLSFRALRNASASALPSHPRQLSKQPLDRLCRDDGLGIELPGIKPPGRNQSIEGCVRNPEDLLCFPRRVERAAHGGSCSTCRWRNRGTRHENVRPSSRRTARYSMMSRLVEIKQRTRKSNMSDFNDRFQVAVFFALASTVFCLEGASLLQRPPERSHRLPRDSQLSSDHVWPRA